MATMKGRRLLLAVLQRTTATELAARCGVHRSQVSRWASGEKIPSKRVQLALEALYGIPRTGWGALPISGAGRTR